MARYAKIKGHLYVHVDESKKGCKLFGHIKNCFTKTKIDTMKKKRKDIYNNDGE